MHSDLDTEFPGWTVYIKRYMRFDFGIQEVDSFRRTS